MVLITCLTLSLPAFAIENSDLLPDHPTPIIDLAKSLSDTQRNDLKKSIEEYEQQSGWKIRVLTQYEQTPGIAVKKFWNLDETSLVLIADPRGGNLLNFNVGEAYFALLPRIFWVELQTRYGNQFYVRDNGEDGAILNSIASIEYCLNKGGCDVVPGLPREQWIWTFFTSILGGLIAGIAAVPRNNENVIAWRWLLLMSPLWLMLFGVFGIAPVISRTSELLPLARNFVSFISCALLAYLFTQKVVYNKQS